MLPPPLPLDQPLPPAAILRMTGGPVAYRRYPVFSAPWLLRRSVVFVAIALSMGVVIALSLGLGYGDWTEAGLVGAHTTLSFSVMMCAGPAFATFVRHRRLRRALERPLVVGAVLLGMASSFVADAYASSVIERQLAGRLGSSIDARRQEHEQQEMTPIGRAVGALLALSIYFSLGGGLALRAYFNENQRLVDVRKKQEMAALRDARQRSDLRLTVLQAQVEPHFLFNTLASVRSLIRADAPRAEHMIDALVDYLRATIPKLRDHETTWHSTLGEQFALCESYLKLMHVRMGDRLAYAFELDDALAARAFPPLILISLVENAIKHGIEPKRGPGRIDVRARHLDERTLEVSVSDTGVGLRPGFGAGLGLANVREQLRSRFGEGARLVLESTADGGTRAALHLPVDPA